MDHTGLTKPIFIIAGVRSGTTMIGDILSKHKDLAYWIEPKYIWKYSKPNTKNDLRQPSEATTKIKSYIRQRFAKYTCAKGKSRFIEKTPSNVFRVAFINEIFPDALFIQLLRSGIETSLSAEKKWTSTPTKSALIRRLTSNEIPLRDLPFYLGTFFRDLVGRFISPKKGYVWGQLFENILEYRAQHTVIETCAKQWSEGLRISQDELDTIDSNRVHRLKYEDLLAQPKVELEKILDFCQLDPSSTVIDYAQQTIKDNTKSFTPAELEKIESIQPIISKQMHLYGYA